MTLLHSQRPLQRLHVNDGLLITASHWQVAHGYHQQRQTIHYQALHCGGIVEGLGIGIADVPDSAPSKYRHPRWLRIQPGLAIDAEGNPIVVSTPEDCYLSAQPSEPTTIYVVLKHSERASQAETEIVQDAFQIIEKNVPAEANEVELCRVRLTPGINAIAPPTDVFAPAADQLDLRFRQFVQARSPLLCRVSSWSSNPNELNPFESLFAAIPTLYPMLKGQCAIAPDQSDLSYLPYDDFCQLDRSCQHQLAQYLQGGGVLLLHATVDELMNLYQAQAGLEEAIALQAHQTVSAAVMDMAEEELTAVQDCITDGITTLTLPIRTFFETEGLSGFEDSTHLVSQGQSSPARLWPFRFSQLPTIHQRPVGLYSWGGVMLLVGPLLQAWASDGAFKLSRDELRTTQELGINILSFAARYRQMHQWLTPEDSGEHSTSNSTSEESSSA